MNDKLKISIEQIKNMQHCIGWQKYNREPKRGIFEAYRNYYSCSQKADWAEELCELGLMKKYGLRPYIFYRVTDKGIKFLEELFSVKIKQDSEDIVLSEEVQNERQPT